MLAEQLGPSLARELGLMETADAERERRTKARDEHRATTRGSRPRAARSEDDPDEEDAS